MEWIGSLFDMDSGIFYDTGRNGLGLLLMGALGGAFGGVEGIGCSSIGAGETFVFCRPVNLPDFNQLFKVWLFVGFFCLFRART